MSTVKAAAIQDPNGANLLPPVGSILAYGGTSAPSGWLLCNGAAVSRTTYATLFAVLGISHGQGNGTTTFNVPDYRGRFLRGVNSSTGVDPDAASRTAMGTGGNTGDNVGSIQADQYASHTHTAPFNGGATGTTVFAPATSRGATAPGPTTDASGGNETRPKNAYVHFIIKY